MKKFTVLSILGLFFTLSSLSAHARTFQGTIQRFTGHFVEVPSRTYDYLAFVTEEGFRLEVPSELNGQFLMKNGNKIIIQAKSLEGYFCTDMSEACLSGMLKQIQKITILAPN